MHSSVTASCINNNSNPWNDSASADGTIYVFAGPVPVQSLAFAPASVMAGQKSTVTLQLTNSAPANGTFVGLMSPASASIGGLPTNVLVPPGKNGTSFKITALASGQVALYATSGEGTDAVGATLSVQ